MKEVPIRIGKKEIKMDVAQTPFERETGLIGRNNAGNGMVLDFEKEGVYPITMRDVPFDLDLAFVNNNREIVDVINAKGSNPEMYYSDTPSRFVIELPAGKHKVQKGDLVGITILPDDTNGKIHILDTHGDTQQIISGNNRIFSRPHTKQLVSLASNAQSNDDYIKLGKKILDILNIQDNTPKEFVTE